MSNFTNLDALTNKYEWVIEDNVDSFYANFENKLNQSNTNKTESSLNSNEQMSKIKLHSVL